MDDHPLVRQALTQLIGQEADLVVCGEAETAPEALRLIGTLKPDVAIVDLTLKDGSGLELVKDLKLRQPGLPVLVLSMHDETLYGERVLRAGARGYVMKDQAADKVVAALRRVLAGEVYLSDKMALRVLDRFAGKPASAGSPVDLLSDRETRGLPTDRPRHRHAPDRGEAPPQRQDGRNLPRAHQDQIEARNRRRHSCSTRSSGSSTKAASVPDRAAVRRFRSRHSAPAPQHAALALLQPAAYPPPFSYPPISYFPIAAIVISTTQCCGLRPIVPAASRCLIGGARRRCWRCFQPIRLKAGRWSRGGILVERSGTWRRGTRPRNPGTGGDAFTETERLLLNRRQELLAHLELQRQLAERLRRESGDELDAVSELSETELDLSVAEIRSTEVAGIEDALRKIVDGTYGRCEMCGLPIRSQKKRHKNITSFKKYA